MAKNKPTTTEVTDVIAEDVSHGLDPERGAFFTLTGEELPLRPVHMFVVERYQAVLEKDKPKIPVIETDHGKDRPKGREAHPNDPIYKEALEQWERNSGVLMMQFMVNVGVAKDAPVEDSDYLEAIAPYFEEMTPQVRKYFWVLSLLSGDAEAAALLEAIGGNAMPTQKGMDDAADSFRSNGE